MKRPFLLYIVLGILFVSGDAAGHICDNIFREANKIIIKAEVSNLVIDKEASFKVFMQSNMRRSIASNVTLVGKSKAFDIEIKPPNGYWIRRGKRYEYTVRLKLKPGFKSGNYPINFDAMVDNRRLRSYSMRMAFEEKTPVRSIQRIPIFSDEVPTIDGRLAEECWKSALRLQTVLNTKNEKPVMPAAVFLTSNGENIYVAIAVRKNGRQRRAQKKVETLTESGLNEDFHRMRDHFMVLFAPPEGTEVYGFKVMPSGKWEVLTFHGGKETKHDMVMSGVKAAVINSSNVWNAELCVPVAVMNAEGKIAGKTWRVNIVRDYGETPQETSFWSGTAENYLESEGFGEVVFSR